MTDSAVAGHQPGAVAVDAGRGDVEEAAVDLCLVAQFHVDHAVGDRCRVQHHIASDARVIDSEIDCGAASCDSGPPFQLDENSIPSMQLAAVGNGDIDVSITGTAMDPDGCRALGRQG